MQLFKTISAVALLAATVAAAPAPKAASTSPNPHVIFTKRDNPANDCGPAHFDNMSSGGSPTVGDCQQIAYNIRNGGSWAVGCGTGRHQLVQYGTCAFGVSCNEIAVINVGNTDIIDLINDSIRQFAWSGLVGAEGTMKCQNVAWGDVDTWWGIWHT